MKLKKMTYINRIYKHHLLKVQVTSSFMQVRTKPKKKNKKCTEENERKKKMKEKKVHVCNS